MDYSQYKAGDVIETSKGKIKLTDPPDYHDGWCRWYAYGQKWIKSKQRFSGNILLHCFEGDAPKKSA
jgi:hypothetical protein